MANPVDFLLNRDGADKQVVEAPAFSLTKVLAIAAPVVTVVAGFIADKWDQVSVDMEAVHFTALTIAVLAFVAIGAAADVLARSIAVKSESLTRMRSERSNLYRFPAPIKAELRTNGADSEDHRDVDVVAMSDAVPLQFLVLGGDGTVSWEDAEKIVLAGVPAAVAPVAAAAAPSPNGKKKR